MHDRLSIRPTSTFEDEREGAPRSLASGRYAVECLLAEGATKRVYRALDSRLDRLVAIAAFRPELGPQASAGVDVEARMLARLGEHPRIPTLYDVFVEGGTHVLVSQYLEGGDLAARLASDGAALPVADVLRLARELCEALAHVHARGVVHRNLGPRHVWLDTERGVALGDFGFARRGDDRAEGRAAAPIGSPVYAAPEQTLAGSSEARSDLYALGALLYEVSTGRKPFAGADAVTLVSQQLSTSPVHPRDLRAALPESFAELVLELLAKDPVDRPQSAGALGERLAAIEIEPASAGGVPNPREACHSQDGSSGSFVGRARELASARAQLDAAISGRGSALVVVGEPGSGKTRLADELAELARRRDVGVLRGNALEDPGAPPYWPWVEVVRAEAQRLELAELMSALGPAANVIGDLVPEVRDRLPQLSPPPPVEPARAGFRLLDCVSGFLRRAAERRPLMIVLDDLQWADEPSLLMLGFLARTLSETSILVVATSRDAELRESRPLVSAIEQLTRAPGSERVRLRGLTEGEVGRLIEEVTNVAPLPGLVSAVHRRTDGNPLYVQEVVRLLAAQGRLDDPEAMSDSRLAIPGSVRDVIARRLDQLSEHCRDALRVAAVLGRDFPTGLLVRVHGPPGDSAGAALAEATAAALLEPSPQGTGHRFTHALLREVLYAEIDPRLRAHLHRRAAEVLEDAPEEDGERRLGELAHHALEGLADGGDADRAIEYARRAAARATRLGAFEDAIALDERALRALEPGGSDAALHLDLLSELSSLQMMARGVEPARRTAQRALELARAEGDARYLARAAVLLAHAVQAGRATNRHEASALLDEAAAALGDARSPERVQLLCAQVRLKQVGPEAAAARDLARKAVELARALGDVPGLATALSLEASSSEDAGVVAAAGRELLGLARESGRSRAHFFGLLALDRAALLRGDRTELVRLLGEQQELAARGQSHEHDHVRRLRLAQLSLLEADWSVAEQRIDEAYPPSRQVSGEAVAGAHLAEQRALVMLARDRLGPLARLAADHPRNALVQSMFAAGTARLGPAGEARELLEKLAVDDFHAFPRDLRWPSGLPHLAEACVRLEDHERAADLYEALLRGSIELNPTSPYAPPRSLALAVLAGSLGRRDDAMAHVREALAFTARLGARLWHTHAQCEYASLLASGASDADRARAASLVEEALAFGRDTGTASSVRRALEVRLALESHAPRASAPSRGRAAQTPTSNRLRLDGEYWDIRFRGVGVRLRDVKGLHDLACLISRPEREVHVTELLAIEAPPRAGSASVAAEGLTRARGSNGDTPALDARARDEYRDRLAEIRSELEEAERWNDATRSAGLRRERDSLVGELAAGLGLGGRSRALGHPVERARKAVSMRIRYAVAKIEALHADLGEHLRASVETGTWCCYRPRDAVRWEL